MAFNAEAFFGAAIPAAVYSGAEAYGARRSLTRQDEYNEWYRNFLEEEAEHSRQQLESDQALLRAFLGIPQEGGAQQGQGPTPQRMPQGFPPVPQPSVPGIGPGGGQGGLWGMNPPPRFGGFPQSPTASQRNRWDTGPPQWPTGR